LQGGVLLFEFGDLRLLFLHGFDQHRVEPILFHAFNLPFGVVGSQQRGYLIDFFGHQAQVGFAALFPVEGHRAQLLDHVQALRQRGDVSLVAGAGRTGRDLVGGVAAQRGAARCAQSADGQDARAAEAGPDGSVIKVERAIVGVENRLTTKTFLPILELSKTFW